MISFNLLLLQEAQEKTDEITAKFLDKEKDPLRYNPELRSVEVDDDDDDDDDENENDDDNDNDNNDDEQVRSVDPRRERRERGRSARHVTQPASVTASVSASVTASVTVRPRSPSHVPVKVSPVS